MSNGISSAVLAYQVLPKVSDTDRKLTGLSDNPTINRAGQWLVGKVKFLKSPVHEAVTLAALGCTVEPGSEIDCVTHSRVTEHRMVLYGVRWPDDPPFRLDADNPPDFDDCDVAVTVRSTSQPKCWMELFFDAEKKAKKHRGSGSPFGPGTAMLYRSHYGDLQFMHAMAASDGEKAATTQARMRTWAKFLWHTALGQVPKEVYLRDLEGYDLGGWFPGDMSSQNLFATGVTAPREHLDQVAFGVLLHMVQDSFSAAHTKRDEETGAQCQGYPADAPGKIRSFRSYVKQNSSRHDAQDTAERMGLHSIQSSPSAVDASRELYDAWHTRQPWEQVEPYFNCLFTLHDFNAESGPGPY
jgi:hypothetical protein